MSDANDVQNSLERMKIHMELRGLQPATAYAYPNCARRLTWEPSTGSQTLPRWSASSKARRSPREFIAHAGKSPGAVKADDVESFLLDLARKGRLARPARFRPDDKLLAFLQSL